MSNFIDTEINESAPATSGVKLFVGQIPREMDEDTLIPYFAEFGPIVELTVIRDRVTKTHKGCAFVTYLEISSAHQAIEQLHDKIKLGSAINPLQVRIAECQVERENKLFIGMLPKTVTEEQLHDMFVRFGDLREVHIIRGPEGSSKGCAFVKFIERQAALLAIEEMNNKVPEGSVRPLVIKFADVKKHGKKIDVSDDIADQMSSLNVKEGTPYWQQPQMTSSQYYYSPYNFPQNGGVPLPQQLLQTYVPYGPHSIQSEASYVILNTPGYTQGTTVIPSGNSLPSDSRNGYSSRQPRSPPPPNDTDRRYQSNYRQGIPQSDSRLSISALSPSTSSQLLSAESEDSPSSPTRPPEGPNGANLFIYHLPRDLTDADLATLFAPFGNVISAKVFVDKKTSESKGFGFVSFDSVESADASIASMNGFQIDSKRLKVQHKKTGEDIPESPNQSVGEGFQIPTSPGLPANLMQNPPFSYPSQLLQSPNYMSMPLMNAQMSPPAMAFQYNYRQGYSSYPNPANSRARTALNGQSNGFPYPSY